MAQKGDFIGFTFNDTHSSDLGIVRTSNGSRYNTNLLPSSSDQTVAVPGGDGVYFFGTNYQTRVFQLQIASDEISEETMRRIQQTWGDKEIHELIFDETPYKVYMAKCTNMPQFNFLCFNENGQRVYKGEGSVEFTCYYPYAKSRYKFLDQYMRQVDLFTQPDDWPINYFTMSDDQYIMVYPGTVFTEGTYYKSIPEWYGGEFTLGNGMFHNHYLLGNGIDIVFEDIYTEWFPTGETEEEKIINWEEHKNELYIKNEDKYIKLSEEAQYNSEEQYYTYEQVSHEQINPSEDYFGSVTSLINQNEWQDASGMLSEQDKFDIPKKYQSDVNNICYVYNPGDIETDFQILFTPTTNMSIILYSDINNAVSRLDLQGISLKSSDQYIQYDSKTELLTGFEDINTPSSNLYNKYIVSGDFFKIPIIKGIDTYHILITNGSILQNIKYNYLYY